ncbi:Mur ligase family protein [Saccharophagus degradans]|nr:Mur ligase family protein [Saccharophagus degradans]WGP00427.1 Mur ligase family protein [Saccharophagus degradans]
METLHSSEIDLGLSRILSVAKSLDIFHASSAKVKNANGPSPTVITVAGTNGKGSFVRSCEAMLGASGMHFGSFTSPHILKYNERIRVDGIDLSDEFICDVFAQIDEARGDTSLTYFEFGALAALLAFHKSNCDYWVLEVGLGGRLDAVNIVDADFAVITSVGLDHEAWLGNTVEVIGREKAGILRANQTAVLASEDLPDSVFDVAQTLGTKCLVGGKDYTYEKTDGGLKVKLNNNNLVELAGVNLPIPSVAAAIQVMSLLDISVQASEVRAAVADVKLAGRFEVIAAEGNVLVLDVAHNAMAMELLAKNLAKYAGDNEVGSVTCVLGMMADKNIAASLAPLLPIVSSWRVCDIPDNKRAATAEYLREVLIGLQPNLTQIAQHQTVAAALNECLVLNKVGDKPKLVVVCGSFFTVCNAKQYINKVLGE